MIACSGFGFLLGLDGNDSENFMLGECRLKWQAFSAPILHHGWRVDLPMPAPVVFGRVPLSEAVCAVFALFRAQKSFGFFGTVRRS